jgi:1-acyl-sn-glycerol-3-phosphate acyltransferase
MRLRSLLFKLYFGLISVIMTVGLAPLLLGPRGLIIYAMRQWARLTLFGLDHIAGIALELRGGQHIPKDGALIAAKHLSMFETIAFHILLADPALVMKRELLRIPLYGQYALRTKMIVVDRSAGAKALRKMLSDAKARLLENRQIVIFPEGTRVSPGAAPDYKPGIAALYAHLGVPCIPVALNSGLFWPKSGPLRRPGKIVVEALAPIPPGLPRADFMARLEGAIEPATASLLAEARSSQHVENASLSVDKTEQNTL